MYDKAVSNGSLIHLYLYPMHLFYQPDIQPISLLSDEEAHHAFHVLRLREGDHIGLLDGTGKRALARIISISKKGVSAEVEEETLTPKPVRNLRLAIAPVKNMDRFEWLAEKATEIGVTVISPVICRRSERKEPEDRSPAKTDYCSLQTITARLVSGAGRSGVATGFSFPATER